MKKDIINVINYVINVINYKKKQKKTLIGDEWEWCGDKKMMNTKNIYKPMVSLQNNKCYVMVYLWCHYKNK